MPTDTTEQPLRKQVFISYQHESASHKADVRRLAETMREAGLPVVLDQFVLDANPGGPDDGWAKWSEDQASQSSCVIIVASQNWFTAYDTPEMLSGGFGAAGEAQVFRQLLYDAKGRNERIRIVFLHPVPQDLVPVKLRAWHQFHIHDNDLNAISDVVKWASIALDVSPTKIVPLKWPTEVSFEPDMADRVGREWMVLKNLLLGRSSERILVLKGASGMGKSELLRQAETFAQVLGIDVARINLKGASLDANDILGSLSVDISEALPYFSSDGGKKVHLLKRDLRALRKPVLIVFDHFEDIADNKKLVDWLMQQLLPLVESASGVLFLIAGQRVPNCSGMPWSKIVSQMELAPITDEGDWTPWIERKYPTARNHLKTILMLARGVPSQVAYYVQIAVESNQ